MWATVRSRSPIRPLLQEWMRWSDQGPDALGPDGDFSVVPGAASIRPLRDVEPEDADKYWTDFIVYLLTSEGHPSSE